jgi:hypothetical protein
MGSVLGNFANDRESVNGQYGDISKGSEILVDSALSAIPGFGTIYAGLNGINDFIAGNVEGASTSGNTVSDAILDSIPGLGLLNASLGKDMKKVSYNE